MRKIKHLIFQVPTSAWVLAHMGNYEQVCPATERHYDVRQIAEIWGLGKDLTRELFRDEPGVVRITRPETRKKRGYVTLRIPQSVMDRVHLRLTKV